MSDSARLLQLVVAVIGVVVSLAISSCREAKRQPDATRLTSAGELRDACSGDSLRPTAAAPAGGLWLYELPNSRQRVAASIGPPRPDDRSLVVLRPVETLEVTVAGDTIRERVDAAAVSLELLPPPEQGAAGPAPAGDSTAQALPAATYAVSPRIRVAAYEPCITSSTGPRIRYLRRDAAGRVVMDVMLRRASDR